MNSSTAVLPFQEVVEAQGHLIDSHIMEHIFDKVVEYNGRFEVEQFRIGRTNGDPSYLRLKVEAPTAEEMEQLLADLLDLGCSPVDPGDAELRTRRARLLRAGGFLLHHQPPHRRCALGQQWVEVAEPAHGRRDRGARRRGCLPPAARCPRRRRGRSGHARHPRHPRIQGARPAVVRLHVATASRPSGRWKRPSARPPR